MSLAKIIASAAEQFKPQGTLSTIQAYGRGNIHDTYLVIWEGPAPDKFILQRINTRVFPKPEMVMKNIRTYGDHVYKRLQHSLSNSGRRWEVPQVLLTKSGGDHWIGPDGSFWRAFSFIEGARSFDTIQDPAHAGEVGYALGMFHSLTYDLPVENLTDTLEGYHVTPAYLDHYETVVSQKKPPQSPGIHFGLEFIERHRVGVDLLEKARGKGILNLRTIHGDPKVNNVLIDIRTGQAVSLVDLDTVKPGLIHYDIGDCLRSCCNLLGEETNQWERVRFDLDICRAILKGYFYKAGDFLTRYDPQYFYEAVRLITFELGLRFFTDYLEGNIYFKVNHKEQNLTRALVQFRVTESIESQEPALRAIIGDLR
jgi:hypothetical protein